MGFSSFNFKVRNIDNYLDKSDKYGGVGGGENI
jgi:hypothetical protein